MDTLPLQGIRVLELGQFVAASFATRLFGDFGAEVIKIEPPGAGDSLREWRGMWKGGSLYWDLQARDKKSVTLDLRTVAGQRIARDLCRWADVLVENFRPGTLEAWGLDPAVLRRDNPRLVVVRISGFGQTGPYRSLPGWASVGEAMGGIRSVTGYPDRPPVRVGVSLGDSLAGMFGAIGALLALVRGLRSGDGRGDVVDVAIYESVFALMESMVSEYAKLGVEWQPSGAAMPGIAPTNTYPTADGQWVIIGANSDSLFPLLMRAIGRPDLADDPRFAHNTGRAAEADLLDTAIGAWTSVRTRDEVERALTAAGVPAGRIYRARDILGDPHYRARAAWIEMPIQREPSGDGGAEGDTIPVQGVCPRLEDHPGRVAWLGPRLGQHNDEVYRGLLGMTSEEIRALREQGVI